MLNVTAPKNIPAEKDERSAKIRLGKRYFWNTIEAKRNADATTNDEKIASRRDSKLELVYSTNTNF
ncbi:MAG: hypothetical protein AB7U98_00390 [Candidatus Nitrosocosmicus sp.]